MDEPSARRVFLAQAIETSDPDGRLLTPAERDTVDRQARQDALQRTGGRAPLPSGEFLHLRARRVLAAVGVHHPSVVALQEPGGWRPWLEWGLPIAALVTGVLTDVVGNPHRLDLVSLPLLGIVVWNVLVYILLAASGLVGRRAGAPWMARLGRWGDGGRAWRLRGDDPRTLVAARFHPLWLQATQGLHVQRVNRVFHVSAAAWAAGVILSLLVRGLVVEYRVGWESTFLGPQQVHAILSVLRLPALLVLPFENFTVEDVAAMRFSAAGGAEGGAPWVWMYVSLLLTVVILPRLLLATLAAWREGRLQRSIPVDLADPYLDRIISLLNATQVRLGLVTHRSQDRDAMMRTLVGEEHAPPIAAASDIGDVLLLEDFPAVQDAPEKVAPPPWWRRAARFLSRETASAAPDTGADIVVHVLGAPEDASVPVGAEGRPVLTVRMPGVEYLAVEPAIDFHDFASCWVLQERFFEAAGRLLPPGKANGYARIVQAVRDRHSQRLRESMAAIARHLLDAARQGEEVPSTSLTVKSLMPGERQAHADARQVAMDAMLVRVRDSSREMFGHLRRLHGLSEEEGEALDHKLEERFLVQQSVDAPQAGMAGAATGAAMGASVDLIAGGMTLGAAAALGALVGGGAAFIAAAWKNRAAPGGGTLVQLSDDMVDALLRSALLRYLAVAHSPVGIPAASTVAWEAEVTQAVKARGDIRAGYWNAARTQPEAQRLVEPLAGELEQLTRHILERILAVQQRGAPTPPQGAVLQGHG